jgi:uncharacterized protein (TIGR03437 family)
LSAWAQTPTQYIINTVAGKGVASFTGQGSSAATAQLIAPQKVAVDSAGNIYFSDSYFNQVFKVSPTGIITVVAGSGTAGYSGDGGQATAAQLDSPMGLAFDSNKNLYIADADNNVIRKVTPAGVISTIAGTGEPGGSGDGQQATKATLFFPSGVAVDKSGTVYIADQLNSKIRMVNSAGVISTFAGTGQLGYGGDNGPATGAALFFPQGVAVDAGGNVYIADTDNGLVRKVTASTKVITSIAGTAGYIGYGGDGGQATSAVLYDPQDVAVDSLGNVYIADFGNNRVREVTPLGIISLFAGTGSRGQSGDGASPLAAIVGTPTGVAVDASNNVYIAEGVTRSVRKVSTGVISRVAGIGAPATAIIGDGGPATSAFLLDPEDVKVDSAGNIYIADFTDNRVRQVTPAGTIGTFAGNGEWGNTNDGAAASSAEVQAPTSLAWDSANDLYISGGWNARKVTPAGVISTILKTSSFPPPNFYITLGAVAADASGNVYIADEADSLVYKMAPTGVVSTFAGNGYAGYSGDGQKAILAELSSPSGLAVDSKGNVYIADDLNSNVRMVTPAGIISTVAGSGIFDCTGDGGPATLAALGYPEGIAFDSSGNLYIADSYCDQVRMVTPAGVISTVAGSGYEGFSGDGGAAADADLDTPNGVGVDSQGNIYIADSGNFRIRKLTAAQIVPDGVVNAASDQSGPVAPGEMVTIFGTGIGPATAAGAQLTAAGLVATTVAQTQVLFNGTPAPLMYVSASQVNAIVPYSVAGMSAVGMQIQYQGKGTNTVQLPVANTSPAIFVISGAGQGAILNQDSSVNGPANPAAPGSIVQIYATGEGVTNPAVTDGTLATGTTFPAPVAPLSVTIGGQAATVLFAGTAPGAVAGFLQVNAAVPSGVSGYLPVVLTVGGVSSPAGVKVAVE